MQGRLELSSNDLGQFPYELNLKAVAAANERELQLRASIGTTQTVTARFVSYARTRADYVCKVCVQPLCYCLGVAAVRHQTRDRKVAGSTPGRGSIKSTRSTQPSVPPG